MNQIVDFENYSQAPAFDDFDVSTLKLPPHSVEAEQSVLGGLLIRGDLFDEVSDVVTADDFFQPRHRRIFSAMAAVHQSGDGIDVITVAESMADIDQIGGVAYLAELAAETPSAANIRAYAKVVNTRAQERALISVGQSITDAGFDTELPLDEKISIAQSEVLAIGRGAGEEKIRTADDNLRDLVETIDQRFRGEAPLGLMTGFRDIDARTNGLQGGDFILIAGRPSMGKTTIALNIAENVSIDQRKPGFIFSMEMPEDQLWQKIGSSLAGISFDKIKTGKLEQEDWPKLSAAVHKAKGAPLFIDDRSALTINQIASTARRMHRKVGLSYILIDYLQLAKVGRKVDSREREISEISSAFKALAKDLKIPVIALSQLNRDLEKRPNKRPLCSDLRDSGSLEQDADLIFFLYRDEVYNSESDQKGIAEVNCAKYRNGKTGVDRLAARLDLSRFENLAYGYEPPPAPDQPDQKSQSVGMDY